MKPCRQARSGARSPKPLQGKASPRLALLLAGVSVAALAGLFWARDTLQRERAEPAPVARIRGEPIQPRAETNGPEFGGPTMSNPLPGAAAAAKARRFRKRHPKPASFQHRMVEFQVSQAEGTNGQTAAGFGGNPAKVIFTAAQLKALPGVTLPPGCERAGFETLAAFPFEVTKEMADGSSNLAAASAATREKIPAAVRALDNHFVAVRGFLLPLKMNNGLAIQFLLMRNQNMCCFGSVPKVNEWICVEPEGAGVKPVMDQPITIIGRLRVGEIRERGYLVGIYKMQNAQVHIHGID